MVRNSPSLRHPRAAGAAARAGEAVLLGPPPAAESYLKGNLIIEAALKTVADIVKLIDEAK